MNDFSRAWSPIINKESKLQSCHCSCARIVNDVEKNLVRERGRREPSSNFQTLRDVPPGRIGRATTEIHLPR